MLLGFTALRPCRRVRGGVRVRGSMWRTGVGAGVALTLAVVPASADTMRWALTQAYINNPQLNSQRAAVRATDEAVPQALSGYRPRVSLTASVTEQFSDTTTKTTSSSGLVTYPRVIGAQAVQQY